MSTTSDFYPNNPKPQKVVHSMVLRGGINITEAKQFESTGDLISKLKKGDFTITNVVKLSSNLLLLADEKPSKGSDLIYFTLILREYFLKNKKIDKKFESRLADFKRELAKDHYHFFLKQGYYSDVFHLTRALELAEECITMTSFNPTTSSISSVTSSSTAASLASSTSNIYSHQNYPNLRPILQNQPTGVTFILSFAYIVYNSIEKNMLSKGQNKQDTSIINSVVGNLGNQNNLSLDLSSYDNDNVDELNFYMDILVSYGDYINAAYYSLRICNLVDDRNAIYYYFFTGVLLKSIGLYDKANDFFFLSINLKKKIQNDNINLSNNQEDLGRSFYFSTKKNWLIKKFYSNKNAKKIPLVILGNIEILMIISRGIEQQREEEDIVEDNYYSPIHPSTASNKIVGNVGSSNSMPALKSNKKGTDKKISNNSARDSVQNNTPSNVIRRNRNASVGEVDEVYTDLDGTMTDLFDNYSSLEDDFSPNTQNEDDPSNVLVYSDRRNSNLQRDKEREKEILNPYDTPKNNEDEEEEDDDEESLSSPFYMVYKQMKEMGYIPYHLKFNRWVSLSSTWTNLGDICSASQISLLSLDFYSLALTRDPEAYLNPHLWVKFSMACKRCGRVNDAKLALQQALTRGGRASQLLSYISAWNSTVITSQLNSIGASFGSNTVIHKKKKNCFPNIVAKLTDDLIMNLVPLRSAILDSFILFQAIVRGFLVRKHLFLGHNALVPYKLTAKSSASLSNFSFKTSNPIFTISPPDNFSDSEFGSSDNIVYSNSSSLVQSNGSSMVILNSDSASPIPNQNINNSLISSSSSDGELYDQVKNLNPISQLGKVEEFHSLQFLISTKANWSGSIYAITLYDVINNSTKKFSLPTPISPPFEQNNSRPWKLKLFTKFIDITESESSSLWGNIEQILFKPPSNSPTVSNSLYQRSYSVSMSGGSIHSTPISTPHSYRSPQDSSPSPAVSSVSVSSSLNKHKKLVVMIVFYDEESKNYESHHITLFLSNTNINGYKGKLEGVENLDQNLLNQLNLRHNYHNLSTILSNSNSVSEVNTPFPQPPGIQIEMSPENSSKKFLESDLSERYSNFSSATNSVSQTPRENFIDSSTKTTNTGSSLKLPTPIIIPYKPISNFNYSSHLTNLFEAFDKKLLKRIILLRNFFVNNIPLSFYNFPSVFYFNNAYSSLSLMNEMNYFNNEDGKRMTDEEIEEEEKKRQKFNNLDTQTKKASPVSSISRSIKIFLKNSTRKSNSGSSSPSPSTNQTSVLNKNAIKYNDRKASIAVQKLKNKFQLEEKSLKEKIKKEIEKKKPILMDFLLLRQISKIETTIQNIFIGRFLVAYKKQKKFSLYTNSFKGTSMRNFTIDDGSKSYYYNVTIKNEDQLTKVSLNILNFFSNVFTGELSSKGESNEKKSFFINSINIIMPREHINRTQFTINNSNPTNLFAGDSIVNRIIKLIEIFDSNDKSSILLPHNLYHFNDEIVIRNSSQDLGRAAENIDDHDEELILSDYGFRLLWKLNKSTNSVNINLTSIYNQTFIGNHFESYNTLTILPPPPTAPLPYSTSITSTSSTKSRSRLNSIDNNYETIKKNLTEKSKEIKEEVKKEPEIIYEDIKKTAPVNRKPTLSIDTNLSEKFHENYSDENLSDEDEISDFVTSSEPFKQSSKFENNNQELKSIEEPLIVPISDSVIDSTSLKSNEETNKIQSDFQNISEIDSTITLESQPKKENNSENSQSNSIKPSEEDTITQHLEEEEKIKILHEKEAILKQHEEETILTLKRQKVEMEAEELKKQQEAEEIKKQQEAEEIKRQQESEEIKKQKEAEEIKKQQESEEIKKQQESEEIKRQQESEELKLQEAEEIKKLQESEEIKKQKEAEEIKRHQEAEELKKLQEAEEIKRQQEAEELKKLQEAEEIKKQKEAEEIKKQQEAEELKKQKEAEEIKRQQEVEELKKLQEAEEIKKQKEADEIKKQQEAEELKKQKEAEEIMRQKEVEEIKMKKEIVAEELKKQKETDELRKKLEAEEIKRQKEEIVAEEHKKKLELIKVEEMQKILESEVLEKQLELIEAQELKNKLDSEELKKQQEANLIQIRNDYNLEIEKTLQLEKQINQQTFTDEVSTSSLTSSPMFKFSTSIEKIDNEILKVLEESSPSKRMKSPIKHAEIQSMGTSSPRLISSTDLKSILSSPLELNNNDIKHAFDPSPLSSIEQHNLVPPVNPIPPLPTKLSTSKFVKIKSQYQPINGSLSRDTLSHINKPLKHAPKVTTEATNLSELFHSIGSNNNLTSSTIIEHNDRLLSEASNASPKSIKSSNCSTISICSQPPLSTFAFDSASKLKRALGLPIDDDDEASTLYEDFDDDFSLDSSIFSSPQSPTNEKKSISSLSSVDSFSTIRSKVSNSSSKNNIKGKKPSQKIRFSSKFNPIQSSHKTGLNTHTYSSTTWSDGRFSIEPPIIESSPLQFVEDQKNKTTTDNTTISISNERSESSALSPKKENSKIDDENRLKNHDGLYINSLKQVLRLGYVPTVIDKDLIDPNDPTRQDRRQWAYAAYWEALLNDFLSYHATGPPRIIRKPVESKGEKSKDGNQSYFTHVEPRPPFYELKKMLKKLKNNLPPHILNRSTHDFLLNDEYDQEIIKNRSKQNQSSGLKNSQSTALGSNHTIEELVCALAEAKGSIGAALERLTLPPGEALDSSSPSKSSSNPSNPSILSYYSKKKKKNSNKDDFTLSNSLNNSLTSYNSTQNFEDQDVNSLSPLEKEKIELNSIRKQAEINESSISNVFKQRQMNHLQKIKNNNAATLTPLQNSSVSKRGLASGWVGPAQLACRALPVREMILSFPGGFTLYDEEELILSGVDVQSLKHVLENQQANSTQNQLPHISSRPSSEEMNFRLREDDNDLTKSSFSSPNSKKVDVSEHLLLNRVASLPLINGISFSQPQLGLNSTSPVVRKRASFISNDTFPNSNLSSGTNVSFLTRANTSPVKSLLVSNPSSHQSNPTLAAIEKARSIVENNESLDAFSDPILTSYPLSKSSSFLDSSSNSPTRRYSYRIHDHVLSSLPSDQPLVLMTRSDALRAQGEEKLLNSDKPHLRDHIQKKFNLNQST